MQLIGYELARISEVYLSTLAGLMKPHGLERHFRLFLFIADFDGELNQAELANRMRKDKVATMRAIDYVEECGLIERVQDTQDKRCQRMKITAKGKELVPVLENAVSETNELLFGHLIKSEVEIFAKSMRLTMKHLNDLSEPDYIIQPQKRTK